MCRSCLYTCSILPLSTWLSIYGISWVWKMLRRLAKQSSGGNQCYFTPFSKWIATLHLSSDLNIWTPAHRQGGRNQLPCGPCIQLRPRPLTEARPLAHRSPPPAPRWACAAWWPALATTASPGGTALRASAHRLAAEEEAVSDHAAARSDVEKGTSSWLRDKSRLPQAHTLSSLEAWSQNTESPNGGKLFFSALYL